LKENEGIDTEPMRYARDGLRLRRRLSIVTSQAFQDGLVEIQDEGSQLVAALVDAQPGMQIADYCAGAGGKTLAIAAGMNNKGRVVAMDVLDSRLDRSAQRLRRAGVHNVERRSIVDNAKWLKRQKGNFDRVLVDAPCTGLGALRRRPEARWRRRPGTPAASIPQPLAAGPPPSVRGRDRPAGRRPARFVVTSPWCRDPTRNHCRRAPRRRWSRVSGSRRHPFPARVSGGLPLPRVCRIRGLRHSPAARTA